MKRSILLLLLAFGFAGNANAEFSYDYVNGSWGQVDFDDLNVDGDGFGIDLSVGIAENFHVFGGVESAGLDFNVDVTRWGAGIGFNTPLSDVMDVIGTLSYEGIQVDTPLGNADDDGFGFGVGLRVAASNLVEIFGGISYVDFSDSGDDTAFDIGALFNATDNFSVGLNGTFDDDVTTIRLAGRFYF